MPVGPAAEGRAWPKAREEWPKMTIKTKQAAKRKKRSINSSWEAKKKAFIWMREPT
jgi:hypothetical protein